MKRNFFAVAAVVVALVFSSFTSLVDTTIYMDYDGVNDETLVGSYIQTQTVQNPESGSGTINWFLIVDKNNGTIDQTEFDARFQQLDVTFPNDDLLSDEPDVTGVLDVKN